MRQHILFWIALVGLAALAALAGLEWFPLQRQPKPPLAAPSIPEARRRPFRERAETLLQTAEADSRERIAVALLPLEDFFAQARERTPRFAEQILGLQGKWAWVTGRQEEFVRRAFEEHLFKSDQLAQSVEQVVQAYLAELRCIDNQLLVQLQADLADRPEALPSGLDPGRLRAVFDGIVHSALQQGQAQVRAEVGADLARLIASEVLATVAVRMAVSSGVVGAGASSSWGTFGVGLAAGLVLDQLLGLVWEWILEPQAKLTGQVRARLVELQVRLVNGDASGAGLRDRLERLGLDRAAICRQAVMALVLETEGGSP
jgi:hypothetical protein